VSSSCQLLIRAVTGPLPYRAVTLASRTPGGARIAIAYQRSGTRQRRLRWARSSTAARPPAAAVTRKAEPAHPTRLIARPYRSPFGSSPGWINAGTSVSQR
jgi:hypothetical protein